MRRRAATLLSAAVALSLSCGGGDSQMMCGADHCGLQGRTVVKWMFDHYPQWLFDSDSCSDFGVATVHVEAVDALGTVTVGDDQCGAGQVTLEGLADGQYTVYATPRDVNGADLVSGPSSATVMAGTFGNDTSVTVQVPWTSWGFYKGTFLFRLTWGGATCSAATPVVVKQVLTLVANGITTGATTDSGQLLDGSDPKPCRELDENVAQSVTMMPFGPAMLTVDGLDGSNAVQFHHEFDTFIGAGISNPTITYDVPMPDAGM